MPNSVVMRFTDPYEYRAFIRAVQFRNVITGPGEYRAELTRIDLNRLWMQRGANSVPSIAYAAYDKSRSPIAFLADARHAPTVYNGVELTPTQIVFPASGAEHYHRTSAGSHWGAMSLTPESLAAAGRALVGYEVTAPKVTQLIQPPSRLMSRLRHLHDAAGHLAATVPDILAHPEVGRAIEQELVHVMVRCLTEAGAEEVRPYSYSRLPVMQRFEELLDANEDQPLYITEICAAIGVADRTLRMHCLEHLGLGPHRYLWLRRMNLARRALMRSDPAAAKVTTIANDHGFAELGRFAVSYRKLFGESPSATLRKNARFSKVGRSIRQVSAAT